MTIHRNGLGFINLVACLRNNIAFHSVAACTTSRQGMCGDIDPNWTLQMPHECDYSSPVSSNLRVSLYSTYVFTHVHDRDFQLAIPLPHITVLMVVHSVSIMGGKR